MSRLTEQGYKIPETLGEAIDKIGEVVFREIEGATDDVEDIDVAWIILIDSLKEKEKLMKLYNIYWTDCYGNQTLIATTNNLDKWLEDNNEDRDEPEESLDDFEIEEANVYIYEEEL